MYTTIETRLRLDSEEEALINSMMIDWTIYYHQAWSMYNRLQKSEKEIYHTLIKNQLTSNQVLSIINKVKTEHSKIKQLTIQQTKLQINKILNLQNFINNSQKELEGINKNIKELKSSEKVNYSKLSKFIQKSQKLLFIINKKKQKLTRLNKLLTIKQNRISSNNFKLCFGSTTLFKQQLGHGNNKHRKTNNQIVYKDKVSWKEAWDLSRMNQIYSIGIKKFFQGNAEIQYYPENNTLRLRLTDKLAEDRMKEYCSINNIDYSEFILKIKYSPLRMQCRFIVIKNVEFNHRYLHVFNQAVLNKLPISAKITKRLTPSGEIGFYLQLSMEEDNNLPQYRIDKSVNKIVIKDSENNINKLYEQILNRKPIMGIDLNANGLAYTIVKVDGNRLVKDNKPLNGFISWDLKDNSTNQNKQILSETLEQIIQIANENNIKEIAIENLDFTDIKSKQNSGFKSKFNKKYNETISKFISSQFKEVLIRKCFRNNILVKLVNPSYSSIGGFVKYGMINKTKADVSASLWIARQGLYGVPYKVEENVVYIKKHEEVVSFPYLVIPKQSKKELNKVKWKDISSTIGKDRSLWYLHTINYIKSLSGIIQTDNLDLEYSLFQDT